MSSVQKKEIFSSFFLQDLEFAISVKSVREVVNTPERFTSMPLSPPYLLGIFNLRGEINPVIDLTALLKLGNCKESLESRKVAIVEYEGNSIGLLFDKTGEVFRSDPEERNDFNNTSSVIGGVFKKDGGKRLIQILDIHQLFKIDSIPLKNSASDVTKKSEANLRGPRKQCISFQVGLAKCAFEISDLQEIIRVTKLNSTALEGEHSIGAIDLRGIIVPVFDFSALLGYHKVDMTEVSEESEHKILILHIGNEFFGLLVNSIESIHSYYKDDLKSFPTLSMKRSQMFMGCLSFYGNEVLLLNGKELFSNEEILQVTHGHSKLYNASVLSEKKKQSSGQRITFITFTIDGVHAIPITEVKEIIDQPDQLLVPPDIPEFCKGVVSLRGQMIPIVDARELYNKPKVDLPSPKVMVFNKNNFQFGLVVDSVEEIVTLTDKEKAKLPEMMMSAERKKTSDIVEVLQYMNSKNEMVNMLVISADSIVKRIRG